MLIVNKVNNILFSKTEKMLNFIKMNYFLSNVEEIDIK